MQTLQKKRYAGKLTPHIDFKPAELKQQSNDNWLIVFYWKPPHADVKMKRYRRRVKYMKSKRERLKYAKIKINHLNDLLQSGWSPENNKTAFTGSFIDLLDMYIQDNEKRYANDNLRYDTLRTNRSFVKSIKEFMKHYKVEAMDCTAFTKKFALAYIDYKEYKCKVSQRTINNHLSFLFTLNKFMLDHEFIETNVVADIKTRKIHKQKIRQRIPEDIKVKIFEHLKQNSKPFYCLALMTYLCFIRRTEITKLKIKHLNLAESLILVPDYISKNKKDGYVTIPKQYLNILSDHVKYAKQDHYIFSNENYKPGTKKMNPRKISDKWYRLRKKLELPDIYQFYSLKDTGITENFEKGIPAIKIRNQARHENISTTELYAPKKQKADDTIKNIIYNL